MNVADMIKSSMESHPRIDFDNGPGLVSEYWSLCPCGFSTPHMKSRRLAEEVFSNHVAEELAIMLMEERLIPVEPPAPSIMAAFETA